MYFEMVRNPTRSPKSNIYVKQVPGTESGDSIRISVPVLFPIQLLDDCFNEMQMRKIELTTTIPVGTANPDPEEEPYLSFLLSTETARPLSTVDLDENVKRDLVTDVERFRSEERAEWYRRRGVPYLRGYLLASVPGCGKSVTCLALASHMN